MTPEQLRRLTALKSRQANKYNARPTGGHASRREHRRATELTLLQRAGLISGLRQQVSYTLLPTQRDHNGQLIERDCRYIADFVYTDSQGNLVVEDTKGFRTPEYIIKRKLMLYIHGIRIREI
ncbi:MAG: DUF1064 domain-containing protein [Muribaculaceae bacterium]|nr:DUF1064 domain-containing protein [Muribaculaceae bacterium]